MPYMDDFGRQTHAYFTTKTMHLAEKSMKNRRPITSRKRK